MRALEGGMGMGFRIKSRKPLQQFHARAFDVIIAFAEV